MGGRGGQGGGVARRRRELNSPREERPVERQHIQQSPRWLQIKAGTCLTVQSRTAPEMTHLLWLQERCQREGAKRREEESLLFAKAGKRASSQKTNRLNVTYSRETNRVSRDIQNR